MSIYHLMDVLFRLTCPGITVTIILRTVLCMFFLKTAYAGFYRKLPVFANIFMFCIECWNM